VPRAFSVHWGNLLAAGVVAGVFIGRIWFGLPLFAIWVGVGVAAVHFLVLPRLAAARVPALDRAMLFSAQKGDAEGLDRALRRAWLIRHYGPHWYVLGRQAWAAAEAGRHEEAERLYERAALDSQEPDRSRFLANLVSVKRKLGKQEEAEKLRRLVARKRPELVEALDQGLKPPPGGSDSR